MMDMFDIAVKILGSVILIVMIYLIMVEISEFLNDKQEL